MPRFPQITANSPRLLGREASLARLASVVIAQRSALTERETQIVELLMRELKDRAIAHQLGMTYNTLRKQLSRLYRKLGVQTRIGVAVAVFSEALKIVAEERDGK